MACNLIKNVRALARSRGLDSSAIVCSVPQEFCTPDGCDQVKDLIVAARRKLPEMDPEAIVKYQGRAEIITGFDPVEAFYAKIESHFELMGKGRRL